MDQEVINYANKWYNGRGVSSLSHLTMLTVTDCQVFNTEHWTAAFSSHGNCNNYRGWSVSKSPVLITNEQCMLVLLEWRDSLLQCIIYSSVLYLLQVPLGILITTMTIDDDVLWGTRKPALIFRQNSRIQCLFQFWYYRGCLVITAENVTRLYYW